MIEATLFTIMTMAFSSLQLLLNVSHLEGERIQIGATLATPPAPDGSTTITSCQQVSLMVERVELPNKRVLFSQGLFPNQPEKALQIHAGEFVAFIGPSGCGKTTVTNILSLKYEQQVELTDSPKWYGTYRMKTDVGDVAVADVSHKSLWTVLFPAPQRTDWVDGTVKENIELHLDNEGFSLDFSPWIRDVFVHEAAGLVDMSPEKLTQTVASLSGGEASRVMLARCLMGALICAYQGVSCVLILDETLSQLDEETAFEVRDRLQELQKYGVAIIMISHNKKLIPVDATVYRFAKDGAGIIECSRGSDFQ
jgi:ABC-type lipoprotein export system ATPase subunit